MSLQQIAGLPDSTRSAKPRLHPPQPRKLDDHMITRLQPRWFDQASREHELASMQAPVFAGEMIGKPGQRVMGMAEHVGAATTTSLDAVDQRAALHEKQIGRIGA